MPQVKLLFTRLAESDLEGILQYISEHRPLTARSAVSRIREKCELIATHPEMGQRRPEFHGDYRSFPVERWVIFYRITQDAVEVHRIIDGARDIDSLLG